MREIIFRGKRKDNGEWIEGSSLKVTINGKTADLIFGDNFSFDGNDVESLSHALIAPNTIGQYTGLKDKNGKRIFEGDVVSTGIKRQYLVVGFRDGCFILNCNDGGKNYYDIMLQFIGEPWTTYEFGEVIGNIHDNPELLKGGEGDG